MAQESKDYDLHKYIFIDFISGVTCSSPESRLGISHLVVLFLDCQERPDGAVVVVVVVLRAELGRRG